MNIDPTITFNSETRDSFKRVYALAKEQGVDPFMFEGNEYVLGYAKYLIEYLDTILVASPTQKQEFDVEEEMEGELRGS